MKEILRKCDIDTKLTNIFSKHYKYKVYGKYSGDLPNDPERFLGYSEVGIDDDPMENGWFRSRFSTCHIFRVVINPDYDPEYTEERVLKEIEYWFIRSRDW